MAGFVYLSLIQEFYMSKGLAVRYRSNKPTNYIGTEGAGHFSDFMGSRGEYGLLAPLEGKGEGPGGNISPNQRRGRGGRGKY